jgi:hypothetical protein
MPDAELVAKEVAADPAPVHDAGREAKVEETPDAWVLRDVVVAVPGVANRALRTAAEFARTAFLWNGVPLIHRHPEGPVVTGKELHLVGGTLQDVRFDAAAGEGRGALIGTYRLLRRSVDGFMLDARAAELNAQWVKRVQASQPVGVSVGYLRTVVRESGTEGGEAYDVRATNIVPNHLALYVGEGLTACPARVCGPSAQGIAAAEAWHIHSLIEGSLTTRHSMPDCVPECKARFDAAVERATNAEKSVTVHQVAMVGIGEALGLGREAKPDQVLVAVRKLVTDEKAAQEALKPLQAAETRRHAKALRAVVDAEFAGLGKEAKDKEDARKVLEDDFKTYSAEQLERHLTTLTRGASVKGGNRDGTQLGAGREASDNLGVANAAKVWPREPGVRT